MTIIILQFTDKEELNEKETQMSVSPTGNSDAQPMNLNSVVIKDVVVNQKEVIICLGRKWKTLCCYCVIFSKNKKQTTTFIGREIKSM